MIELGGNITLKGFKELGYAELVVVKKVVGSYARKFADKGQMNTLSLTLKLIHHTAEDSSKYEVKGMVDLNGKIINTEVVDFNLFMCLDDVLKKLEVQIFKS